jgi:hypothetical protein
MLELRQHVRLQLASRPLVAKYLSSGPGGPVLGERQIGQFIEAGSDSWEISVDPSVSDGAVLGAVAIGWSPFYQVRPIFRGVHDPSTISGFGQ